MMAWASGTVQVKLEVKEMRREAVRKMESTEFGMPGRSQARSSPGGACLPYHQQSPYMALKDRSI